MQMLYKINKKKYNTNKNKKEKKHLKGQTKQHTYQNYQSVFKGKNKTFIKRKREL